MNTYIVKLKSDNIAVLIDSEMSFIDFAAMVKSDRIIDNNICFTANDISYIHTLESLTEGKVKVHAAIPITPQAHNFSRGGGSVKQAENAKNDEKGPQKF